MTISLTTSAQDASTNSITALVDAGTIQANGRLLLQTAEGSTIATLNLSTPAFGASASGEAVSNAIEDDLSAIGGLVATFRVVDRDSNTIFTGTVSGVNEDGDLQISDLTVDPGDRVTISSLTFSQPSS